MLFTSYGIDLPHKMSTAMKLLNGQGRCRFFFMRVPHYLFIPWNFVSHRRC